MNVAPQRVVPVMEPDPEREFLTWQILMRHWPEARSADAYRQHLRYALHLDVECWCARFYRAWNEAGVKLRRR